MNYNDFIYHIFFETNIFPIIFKKYILLTSFKLEDLIDFKNVILSFEFLCKKVINSETGPSSENSIKYGDVVVKNHCKRPVSVKLSHWKLYIVALQENII